MIDTFANRIVALRDLHANPFRVTAGRLHGLPKLTSFSPLGRFASQIAYRATDALEQALYARRPTYQGGLIHHSDRPSYGLQANRCRATGGQYVSIRYTERLAKAGIEPSVGSVGDAYDRASGRHSLPGRCLLANTERGFKTTGEGFG